MMPRNGKHQQADSGIMASVMALLMSGMFHVGLAVIFFFVIWLQVDTDPRPEILPTTISAAPTDIMSSTHRLEQRSEEPARVEFSDRKLEAEVPDAPEPVRIDTGIDIIWPTVSDDIDQGPEIPTVDLPREPTPFPAHHVVFVIDASGSMTSALDQVRREMLMSISGLTDKQTFHIIFFNDAFKEQFSPGRLVDATMANKEKAAQYLMEVRPRSIRGYTDPTESLKRAFAALSKADPARKGKMIFLLTDGAFTGTTDNALLDKLDTWNRERDVAIFTSLYSSGAETSAASILEKIATRHGGRFRRFQEGR